MPTPDPHSFFDEPRTRHLHLTLAVEAREIIPAPWCLVPRLNSQEKDG
jgi:hypothetical protein